MFESGGRWKTKHVDKVDTQHPEDNLVTPLPGMWQR